MKQLIQSLNKLTVLKPMCVSQEHQLFQFLEYAYNVFLIYWNYSCQKNVKFLSNFLTEHTLYLPFMLISYGSITNSSSLLVIGLLTHAHWLLNHPDRYTSMRSVPRDVISSTFLTHVIFLLLLCHFRSGFGDAQGQCAIYSYYVG